MSKLNLMVFDIETIPDTDAGRMMMRSSGAVGADAATEAEVGDWMIEQRQAETDGDSFLKYVHHKIACISYVIHREGRLSVGTLPKPGKDEKSAVAGFFGHINKHMPLLISWNGSGFDLPVLNLRALKYRTPAAIYNETGARNRDFKYNNYKSRYHHRHTDLMDELANHSWVKTSLQDAATLCGLPGKIGVGGEHVWQAYKDGDIEGIRNYCELDVVNTYLVYLNYLHNTEALAPDVIAGEERLMRQYLFQQGNEGGRVHLKTYLDAWDAGQGEVK